MRNELKNLTEEEIKDMDDCEFLKLLSTISIENVLEKKQLQKSVLLVLL